jgi:hypothetical protein
LLSSCTDSSNVNHLPDVRRRAGEPPAVAMSGGIILMRRWILHLNHSGWPKSHGFA